MTAGASQWLRCAALALLALAANLGVSPSAHAQTQLQAVPSLTARVTDLTGTLTAQEQTSLEQKLAAFEAAKGAQLAVLLVASTAPEDIEQYSIRVAEQWKLGRKGIDDGALLLVAKNDRRVRIEVGRGLEGVLTDALSNRIIDETVKPAFRQGNFYGGIDAGLGQMMKLVQGEPLPPPQREWQSSRHTAPHGGGSLPLILFAVLVGSAILRGVFGRTIGSTLTGVGAGFLVWVAGYALALAGLAALGAFLFTLLGGLSRGSGWSNYPRSGGLGGGWGGFGGGLGGGFGGGSGGGFSGGGGGFAGGGASGSW
jgi:uncharacterized protein